MFSMVKNATDLIAVLAARVECGSHCNIDRRKFNLKNERDATRTIAAVMGAKKSLLLLWMVKALHFLGIHRWVCLCPVSQTAVYWVQAHTSSTCTLA